MNDMEVTREELFEKIQNMLVSLAGEDKKFSKEDIKLDTNLIDLGFDSLDVIDMMDWLEIEYKEKNLEYDATDAYNIRTPNEIIDLTLHMFEHPLEKEED